MKYCKKCGSEYLDHLDSCNTCDPQLISTTKFSQRKEENAAHPESHHFTRVCILENRFEADLIGHALDREGVPFIIKEFGETAYDGLFIPQFGWGSILVPNTQVQRAKTLLEDIRKNILEQNKGNK